MTHRPAPCGLRNSRSNLSVQVANLGGGVPFYLERLRAVAAAEPAEAPDKYRFDMRRIVVDTASFGRLGIGLARKALGADKVVLGTDMPVFDALTAVAAMQEG